MTEVTASTTVMELEPARLGFVGLGNIGKPRMRTIVTSGAGTAIGVFDPRQATAQEAVALASTAQLTQTYDELLAMDLDGVVIASPTGFHAGQAVAALERGIAVFCQKPLGINASETRRVIDAARQSNTLLGVDLSHRHTEAMRIVRSTVQAGELGDIYAVNATYHSASGPTRSWARDPKLSGGGCVMDLGSHVIDLALWTLGFPRVTNATSVLFARGERLSGSAPDVVEDYATALLELDTGIAVQLACSWNLPAGCDAEINVTLYGTEGGASFRNVNGSFVDFTAELFRGTHRHVLAAPPDDWSGRAAVAWAQNVARGKRYDPWVEGVADVASAIDRILQR